MCASVLLSTAYASDPVDCLSKIDLSSFESQTKQIQGIAIDEHIVEGFDQGLVQRIVNMIPPARSSRSLTGLPERSGRLDTLTRLERYGSTTPLTDSAVPVTLSDSSTVPTGRRMTDDILASLKDPGLAGSSSWKEAWKESGFSNLSETQPELTTKASEAAATLFAMKQANNYERPLYDALKTYREIQNPGIVGDGPEEPVIQRLKAALRQEIGNILLEGGNDYNGVNLTSPINGVMGVSVAHITDDSDQYNAFCLPLQMLNREECQYWLKTVRPKAAKLAPEPNRAVHSAIVLFRKKFARPDNASSTFQHICTGFKVTEGFAITAAHCCPAIGDEIYFTEYADLQNSSLDEKISRKVTETVTVADVTYPEGVDRDRCVAAGDNVKEMGKLAGVFAGDDITLMAYTSTNITRAYTPIPILSSEQLDLSDTVYLTGYGNRTSAGSNSFKDHPPLHFGIAPIMTDDCETPRKIVSDFKAHDTTGGLDLSFPATCVKSREIVVGFEGVPVDTSKGDSGGPQTFHMDKNGKAQQAALSITSRAQKDRANKPGSINTRLDAHLPWIKREAGEGVVDTDLTRLFEPKPIPCVDIYGLFDTKEESCRAFNTCLKIAGTKNPALGRITSLREAVQ